MNREGQFGLCATEIKKDRYEEVVEALSLLKDGTKVSGLSGLTYALKEQGIVLGRAEGVRIFSSLMKNRVLNVGKSGDEVILTHDKTSQEFFEIYTAVRTAIRNFNESVIYGYTFSMITDYVLDSIGKTLHASDRGKVLIALIDDSTIELADSGVYRKVDAVINFAAAAE